ncbi:MAG: hypothetical protein DRJ69_01710 [Thermoprotei archaeon]|nr:MAG: hypothetical protein DRJ69_01710 [Thermoprotei archaeon]
MPKYGWDELAMLLAKAFAMADGKCAHRHCLILMVEDHRGPGGGPARSRYWTVYLGDLDRIKAALRDLAEKEGLCGGGGR